MRAYLGYLRADGLARLILEEIVPDDQLDEVLAAWSRPESVVFRTILAEDDIELIRHESRCGHPDGTVAWFWDRATELLPIANSERRRTTPRR